MSASRRPCPRDESGEAGIRPSSLCALLRPEARSSGILLKALAVVYGIEAMIILKDICGAGDKETKAVVHWMMDALIDAALKRSRKS